MAIMTLVVLWVITLWTPCLLFWQASPNLKQTNRGGKLVSVFQLLSYIFFAPILSIPQYPLVLAKLEWLMMAQNPPGPDLHIFVWLLPYVPRSKQDIYSVCNSTFPDSKETFLIKVNPPPPCLTILCRQGFLTLCQNQDELGQDFKACLSFCFELNYGRAYF